MADVWYAVCDQTRARFFAAKPFELVGEIDNELGRTRNREMQTDRPGFSRAKFGSPSSIHALTGEKDPHEDAAFVFAGQIGDFLDRHYVMKDFSQVVIVADPRMSGKIHNRMTKRLSQHATWIQKDLGKVSDRHLPGPLGLPQTVLPGFARLSTRSPGT